MTAGTSSLYHSHDDTNHPFGSQRPRTASTQHRLQFGDDKIYSGSEYDLGSWNPHQQNLHQQYSSLTSSGSNGSIGSLTDPGQQYYHQTQHDPTQPSHYHADPHAHSQTRSFDHDQDDLNSSTSTMMGSSGSSQSPSLLSNSTSSMSSMNHASQFTMASTHYYAGNSSQPPYSAGSYTHPEDIYDLSASHEGYGASSSGYPSSTSSYTNDGLALDMDVDPSLHQHHHLPSNQGSYSSSSPTMGVPDPRLQTSGALYTYNGTNRHDDHTASQHQQSRLSSSFQLQQGSGSNSQPESRPSTAVPVAVTELQPSSMHHQSRGSSEEVEGSSAPSGGRLSAPGSPTKGIRSKRMQNRGSIKTQPYPMNTSAACSVSPVRSRSSSLKSGIPPALQISTSALNSGANLSSPAVFSGGLPSPFRQPSTPNSATIDPAQFSGRSSSPSSISSVSANAMSRVGSSSAASSTTGNEITLTEALNSVVPTSSNDSARLNDQVTVTATPNSLYRSNSRRGSPTKNGSSRSGRKLSDFERRQICLYQLSHSGMRQDLVGHVFNVDRTTVSKILRDKEKWMAISGPITESLALIEASAPEPVETPPAATYQQETSLSPSGLTTPHQSPPPQSNSFHTVSAPMSSSSSISGLFSSLSTSNDDTTFTPQGESDLPPELSNRLARELHSWWQASARLGSDVSDEAVKAKAKEVASKYRGLETFKPTTSWLRDFRKKWAGAGFNSRTPTIVEEPSGSKKASQQGPTASVDEESEDTKAAHERSRRSPKKKSKRQSIISVRRANKHADDAAATGASISSLSYSIGPSSANNNISQPTASALNSSPTKGLTASLSAASISPNGTLKANKMIVDSRTPLRSAFAPFTTAGDTSVDSEATPTHSTIHSRATSASAADQQFNETYSQYNGEPSIAGSGSLDHHATLGRSPSYGSVVGLGTPSRSGSFGSVQSLSFNNSYPSNDASPSPYSYGMPSAEAAPSSVLASSYTSSTSGGGGTDSPSQYPLQSPFQPGSRQSSSHSLYSNSLAAESGLPGSGTNSPQPSYFQHGRSGSITSIASSYSGLTAFSSQNSQGTPLTGSLSGSFPHSQANSIPSTPALGHSSSSGYYSHGPSGTQSQLQAAFGSSHSQSSKQASPQTVTPSLLQGGAVTPNDTSPSRMGVFRRQTISGYAFNPSPQASSLDPAPPTRIQSQSQAFAQQSMQQASPTGISPKSASSGSFTSSNLAGPVTAMQAFEGIMLAYNWLTSSDARGFVQPGDLVASSELRGRLAERLGITLPTDEPSTSSLSSSMSSSMSLPGSRGATPSLASSTNSTLGGGPPQPNSFGGKYPFPTSPVKPAARYKLSRTQSTSSIITSNFDR